MPGTPSTAEDDDKVPDTFLYIIEQHIGNNLACVTAERHQVSGWMADK